MAFRFIHAADLHIDSPLKGLQKYEGAPELLLRGSTRRAVENLTGLAIEESVNFLLLAGDIYDGDWKDYSTGLFFRRQMVRLREHNIAVFLIKGNHDAESVISRQLQLPDNVTVLSAQAAESIEVPGLPVVVHGQSFSHRTTEENLAAHYPEAVSNRFNIGLLHTSLNGHAGHATYAPCSIDDLRDKGYQYWALGHIHQPKIVSETPWIIYSGNTQGRHARETGRRGCTLVNVENDNEVTVEFRTTDEVRWESISIDVHRVDTMDEIAERISQQIGQTLDKSEGRPLALRLTLTGNTKLHTLLQLDSAQLLANIHTIVQDIGRDAIWIEKVRIYTQPLQDLKSLAERDPLTRTILDSMDLDKLEQSPIPGDINAMLATLPTSVSTNIKSDWEGARRTQLYNDVRSLVLASLESSGDEDT